MLRLVRYKKREACLIILLLLLSMILTVALNSCGVVGGGGSDEFAGGGIGGTGKYTGVISGFGSVFVNEIKFDTTSASIIADEKSVTEDSLKVGMKIQLEAIGSSALDIVFEPEVKGPVESIDTVKSTLLVLGQNIVIGSTTILDGINSINDLQAGDNVVLSGFFNSADNILATYIGLEAHDLLEFKVQGTISNHDSNNKTFNINSLAVNYSLVENAPDIDTGSFVQIKGNMLGNTFMANNLEEPPPFASAGDELEIEGVITHVASLSDFKVDGLMVQTNVQTQFEYGTASDIAEDVWVEVEGEMDSRGILIADEVEFRFFIDKDVKIEGRVETVDSVNSTVTVFGISVNIDDSTQFIDESQLEMEPFTLDNIEINDFLEIGGFVNEMGDVVAVKLERDDYPGPGKDILKGPVDSETPNTAIEILSRNIDVSGAEFRDIDEIDIDAGTFFGIIDPGDLVKVRGKYEVGIFTADKADIKRVLQD
jgi:hypothetical protein